MKNNEHINRLTDQALNSLDGAARATPKPFLLTRLRARMQNQNAKESNWDNALRFISRPAVALVGLCLIIGINAMVVSYNYPGKAAAATDDQYALVDEYSSSSVAVLKDIENIEP